MVMISESIGCVVDFARSSNLFNYLAISLFPFPVARTKLEVAPQDFATVKTKLKKEQPFPLFTCQSPKLLSREKSDQNSR